MEPKVLDDHSAFNRYQVMQGMRVDEAGTKPSVYITEIKLKKVFNRLGEHELKRVFEYDQPLSKVAIGLYQKKLYKKLEKLQEEQVLTALNIYLREEDGELCAKYVMACSVNKRKKD